MIDQEFLNRASEAYHQLAEIISKVRTSEKIYYELPIEQMDARGADQLFGALKAQNNQKCIYVIEAVKLDTDQCHKAFQRAKDIKKDYSFALVNEPCKVFYVGSSNNLKSRLKNHLGLSSKQTYSLQLAQWIKPFKGALRFTVYYFHEEVEQSILEALEDALWQELKPMFGRQGGR